MAAIEWPLMKYTDQQEIQLGDVVELAMPGDICQARVVMLGSDYSHLALEQSFEKWLKKEKLLSIDSIVIE